MSRIFSEWAKRTRANKAKKSGCLEIWDESECIQVMGKVKTQPFGPVEVEVKDDEQLVRIEYDLRGTPGKVKRKVVARPVHAVHISDERDERGRSTEKTPVVDGDKMLTWRP